MNRGNVRRDYLSTLGIDVDLDIVKSYAGDGNLGRPHFARYLVETGLVNNRKAAFDKYLDTAEFKLATGRKKPRVEEVVRLIQSAGGKAVLVHPGQYKDTDIATLVKRMAEIGLEGIECFYSKHDKNQTQEYLRLVKQYGLRVSCGSDFHGEDVKADIRIGMELAEEYKNSIVYNRMSAELESCRDKVYTRDLFERD